jgi:spermidine synthase
MGMTMSESWFTESDPFSPINYRYAISHVLHERRSAIQEIKVLEHSFFGRILVLDDVVQLTERDEFMYHEMLTHVPMHSHPNPERVLVIGGGDGGTLREVLKHPSVQSATLVDIDPEVSDVSRLYFPTLSCSFPDPRSALKPGDGAVFLAETTEKFDVILVDAPDPVGPAETLTTQDFYRNAITALTDRGVLAIQTESLHFHFDFVQQIQKTLAGLFPSVALYAAPLATYAGNWWTFSIASKMPLSTSPARTSNLKSVYYSADAHEKAFVPARVLANLAKHYAGYPARHTTAQ